MPFTGPGSRLALDCTKTKAPLWKWLFHPPLCNADPSQLDGKGLSYSIRFADLHETAVFQTYSYAKVKEVSTSRLKLCREAWMLTSTSPDLHTTKSSLARVF